VPESPSPRKSRIVLTLVAALGGVPMRSQLGSLHSRQPSALLAEWKDPETILFYLVNPDGVRRRLFGRLRQAWFEAGNRPLSTHPALVPHALGKPSMQRYARERQCKSGVTEQVDDAFKDRTGGCASAVRSCPVRQPHSNAPIEDKLVTPPTAE
jgi:hypothetical protein